MREGDWLVCPSSRQPRRVAPNCYAAVDTPACPLKPSADFRGVQSRLTAWPAGNNIIITMKSMHVSIRQIGNSQGVVIPKPLLLQLGLSSEAGAEMSVEGDALVLRRPANPVRAGWAEAAKKIAESDGDQLVMGEFANAEDKDLTW
jgi:antitoxin MazE